MPRQSLIAAALLLGLSVCDARAAYAAPQAPRSPFALAGPAPVPAADEPPEETPEELAREGMERLLKALELFIEMIPQYEMPEVTEEGDIIIRRKRPKDPPPPDPEIEETET